jgi:hypothetical protein
MMNGVFWDVTRATWGIPEDAILTILTILTILIILTILTILTILQLIWFSLI